jgi:hypothetical protein
MIRSVCHFTHNNYQDRSLKWSNDVAGLCVVVVDDVIIIVAVNVANQSPL